MSNTLVYVDDSVTMQTVAEITFRQSEWQYIGAKDASEARAAATSAALILVDARLADGASGYDLAKELGTGGTPVVLVCGNSEPYDESKGQAAGCRGHIVKPWQTDKVVEALKVLADGDATKTTTSAAPAPEAAPAPAAPPAAAAEPPRSATLMGMPALDIPPPSRPLPAGVAAIPTGIPKVKPVAKPSAAPAAAAPASAAPAATGRAPMVKGTPGKPIRLVLASQAEAAAAATSQAAGLSSDQAGALNAVSRELLEQIIWEVVPDLAETIIRENLDTLTSKAR